MKFGKIPDYFDLMNQKNSEPMNYPIMNQKQSEPINYTPLPADMNMVNSRMQPTPNSINYNPMSGE